MSTFNVGDKVRQIKPRKPYQSIEGLVGVVAEISLDDTFDIWVDFPGGAADFPFAASELELVHE